MMNTKQNKQCTGGDLILVPHQDDEILLAAGIIHQAVLEKRQIKVVIATNGDYGCEDYTKGRTRLLETIKGTALLGLPEKDLIFMGYADTGMPAEESFLTHLYEETDAHKIVPSSCSDHTYSLPDKDEYHMEAYGCHAPYNRESFKQDLKSILCLCLPDRIYTTSGYDTHGDHSALYYFTKEVLAELAIEAGFKPALYFGIVHSFAGDDCWPSRNHPLFDMPPGFEEENGLLWHDRIRIPTPEDMKKAGGKSNLKYQALSQYEEALEPEAYDFLMSFVKDEELFFEDGKKPIYPIEAWSVTETDFDLRNNYRNETTFSLSNGYIGTRGTFEESYPFDADTGLEGNFINGFYESEEIRYGEANFGSPKFSQSLLNLPDLKETRLLLNEELFDMREGTIEDYSRTLLLKEGILKRKLLWTSPCGKKVEIEINRLVSFAVKNIMAIQYRVRSINFTGSVRFLSRLNADVENHTRKTNPIVDYGPFGRHIEPDCISTGANGSLPSRMLYYEGTTKNSGLTMSCGSIHKLSAAAFAEDTYHQTAFGAEVILAASLQAGQDVTLEKFICYTSSLDMERAALQNFVLHTLEECSQKGYVYFSAFQKNYMDHFWEAGNVEIEGETALTQGIRFNLFHTMQAAGRDGRTGMGAKGLSGEGYEGHYFWDTEMYVLPVLLYTQPSIAKSLLDYRYSTLDQARARAKILGHEKGALYPWRTINGEEASTYYPLGTAQYHINADIAYALSLYVQVTRDTSYLIEKGAEILIETARIFADAGSFAACRDGKYCICSVTGPDEYNVLVDNNFYTNFMARETLRDALKAAEYMKNTAPGAYTELCDRIHLEQEELTLWKTIADRMYFPFDEERQIYPLDDGFMMRKPWDDSKIPVEKRAWLYENYHPLFIMRHRMSKQADAMIAMYLHNNQFTKEEIKRNYDFYQEVTLHHSSLSTCIFGIVACDIGYQEEAYRYFAQSARMDLDDHHHNFYSGIHAANMAGTWQAIVNGFAGMRCQQGILRFSPFLPEEWSGYHFTIRFADSVLKVDVEKGGSRFTLAEGSSACFFVKEKEVTIKKTGDSYYEKI